MIRALILYLLVGEVYVALLVTFSRKYCDAMKGRSLALAVLGCGWVIVSWPSIFLPAIRGLPRS